MISHKELLIWYSVIVLKQYILYSGEVKKILEKILEHIAIKHATSASCYMFFEPKMPRKLIQMIKKDK
ncbi:cyclic lactone autoinducer peptide [Eubacterium sp. MSJ-13]|uniref:AgrD family cyclic lactone autoinducer peptide n=1 Tax=Eubacterium sp. MSJ-13 TaxID=2841513 RepID=UPI001C10F051|nr:cyclic lactone autoinducer peptide [Eubacterium sp. MSJ-13]